MPSTVGPAKFCCAEQVAVGVGDQAALRIGTVGAVEADQGRKFRLSDFSCPDLVEDRLGHCRKICKLRVMKVSFVFARVEVGRVLTEVRRKRDASASLLPVTGVSNVV